MCQVSLVVKYTFKILYLLALTCLNVLNDVKGISPFWTKSVLKQLPIHGLRHVPKIGEEPVFICFAYAKPQTKTINVFPGLK